MQPYDAIASSDIDQWLSNRALVLSFVKQHLDRAKVRRKLQAYRNRIDHQFAVGDSVFLKLQPYVQASVMARANHKLSFKYYGPYTVIERVGEVAYKLDLPSSSKIHPAVHVSLLKKFLKPTHQLQSGLPPVDAFLQVPEVILKKRLFRQVKKRLFRQ